MNKSARIMLSVALALGISVSAHAQGNPPNIQCATCYGYVQATSAGPIGSCGLSLRWTGFMGNGLCPFTANGCGPTTCGGSVSLEYASTCSGTSSGNPNVGNDVVFPCAINGTPIGTTFFYDLPSTGGSYATVLTISGQLGCNLGYSCFPTLSHPANGGQTVTINSVVSCSGPCAGF